MKISGVSVHERRMAISCHSSSLCRPLFIATLPALSVLLLHLASAATSSLDHQAQALILFKKGITQDPLGWLASWSNNESTAYASHPYCGSSSTHQHAVAHWAGISCDAQQLHVVTVNLRSFNLSGSISSSLALLPWLSSLDLSDNHLSGQLPVSLFGSEHFPSTLQYLNLSFNSLGGNLPHAIGNLSALTQLDLSYNLFKGPLPASIWHLPKLQLLWLESPGGADPLGASLPVSLFGFCPTIKDIRLRSLALAGQIPPSLGQCKQLQFLVLHDNSMQGIIPQGIWQLPALRVLYLVETVYAAGLQMEPVPETLSFCPTITQLWLQGFVLATSTIRISPSLGDCKQLEFLILDVGGNLPSGFVTPGIWQLPQLRVLTWVDLQTKNAIDQSFNGLNRSFQLSGSLPETFGFCSTITHLQIDGVNLTGEIPPSLGSCKALQYLELSHGSLHGALPATLQNLTCLQGLSFESNFITGGIPTWISNFSELTGLDLGDNPLGGRLPAEIGQLKQLQVLSLFTANLSGPVPEELGNCTQLEWLDLGSSPIYLNRVEGFPNSLARLKNLKTLAWSGDVNASFDVLMHVLGNLTLLEYIRASFCGVYGDIPPQFGDRFLHLTYVDLSSNEITGLIPPQLGNLSLLTYLDLLNNHLDGPLPRQLASLSSKLQSLNLGGNNFSGSIPPWLGQFSELQYLNLGTNRFTGSIPYQFFAGLGNSSIARLYLDNNQLQEVVPSSIGRLKTVKVLYINNNHLEGEIPPSLGNCSALQDLSLANNKLEGQIPPTLGQLLSLTENLLLSNNSLRGEIPKELGNLVQLKVLDLSRNRLGGQIPRALQNCTGLVTLRLFGNRLIVEVAELDISRMESLQTFTVQNNLLVGDLPAFTNSNSLILVDIGNNSFSGEISTGPVKNPHALSNLRVLSMASNRIKGVIPKWVWDLPSLQLLDLSNNLLTGNMPHTLSHLQYLRGPSSTKINGSLTLYEEVPVTLKDSPQVLSYVLNSRMLLDLSMNSLEGSISESFGELIGLISLNFSHNRITGGIPSSLSNLSQLESLDVSWNNLTGGIPEGLGALSSLSAFDVSSNQLQGPIPTLDNFNTRFGNRSFESNPGLCGFPLSKPCQVLAHHVAQGVATPPPNRNPLKKWLSDSVSLGGFFVGNLIGVVAGVCLTYLAFKYCMCSKRLINIACSIQGL